MTSSDGEDGAALEAPVCHESSAGRTVPLIWVADGGAPPADELARRVEARVRVASSPSAQPSRPSSDVIEEVCPENGGAFGARQRPWLTRLTWAPAPCEERRLIVSERFLDAATLSAFAAEMPRDAVPVPMDADGIVDGITAEGVTAFYALFEGPDPWRAVALSPVLPPFDELLRPMLLGEVETRLQAMAARLQARVLDPAARELLESAMAVLDP